MLIDDLDFIELYKWLWYRHKDMEMRQSGFSNSIETFLMEHYHGLLTDDTDKKVTQTLINMGLVKHCGEKPYVKIQNKVHKHHVYKLIYNEVLEE